MVMLHRYNELYQGDDHERDEFYKVNHSIGLMS